MWHLARVNSDEWRPIYVAPLTWLLTLPVKWLPSGVQLLGLNFISALCAALSLAWLARSVSILPHDRTQLQRNQAIDENGFLGIRLAWVPVVIAVVMCGFQRSFWEHAIVGTGEMIDLLLFAYCVRGLLEYRVEEKNSWLYKVAVVYAPTGPNRDFICFEPMTGPTNAFNLAHRGIYKELQTIPAGPTWQESYWIRPIGF